MLSEGPADDFNDSIGAAEKKVSINLSKAKTNFARVCIAMLIIIVCLLTQKNL